MIRTLVLAVATLAITASVMAQKSNVESAAIYLRNSEMEDAIKSIELAASNEETRNDLKMWYYRAAIYDTVYRNAEYAKYAPNMAEILIVSSLQCLKNDPKKRYEEICSFFVIDGAFAAYNKAIDYIVKKQPDSARIFFNYVLEVFPYDKNKDLTKNNINVNNIELSLADVYLKQKDYTKAQVHMQKLIDADYNDPIVYYLMTESFFNLGDTAKGMTYLEQGRKRFPEDKNLISMELNIYLAQGKQQVLVTKLTDAINLDDQNAILYYVRGTIYDGFSKNTKRKAQDMADTVETLNKKAKKETTPAGKSKFENAAKKYRKESDSLMLLSNNYMMMSEKDYMKAIEVNPEYFDAYYNLGALTNNKSTEWVDKMNALSINTPNYDKRYKDLQKTRDSILTVSAGYFTKALNIAEGWPDTEKADREFKKESMITVYKSLQNVYANMNDEKKTVEIMNKRRELEDQ